jgi:hypothetical protein
MFVARCKCTKGAGACGQYGAVKCSVAAKRVGYGSQPVAAKQRRQNFAVWCSMAKQARQPWLALETINGEIRDAKR